MPSTALSRFEILFALNNRIAEGPKPVIRYLQVFSNKIETSLASNAAVANVAHVVFINCSAKFWRWLIGNGHNELKFLPFFESSDSKDSCSPDETRWFLYFLTDTDEIHAKESCIFSYR